MRKAAFVLALCLMLVVTLMCLPDTGSAAEHRALWVDGWHTGMWTQSSINTMISLADNANYNVIVPQIRKKADALYNSTFGGPVGTGEPKPSQVQPPSFDPLAYMIQEAHARGMEVHPWLCTHRVATLTSDWFYVYHPDWLTRNYAGGIVYAEGYYLDPGVPAGEEYTVSLMLDIVSRYDVDGIQWDRIRYPQKDSGYNTIAITRFQNEYGYIPLSTDNTFSVWRRKQLNDFVARVYAQIMEINPNVAVGANTWANYSSGNGTYFQDSAAWMAGHWLDIDVPMIYTSDNNYFDARLQEHLVRRNGRYVYGGHNIGYNTFANSVTQINHTRSYNTAYGVPWGNQTYSYYYATGTKVGWFDYVSDTGRPYASPDSVPTMPWKTSPTQGIILGRVTDASNPGDPIYYDWIYQAEVRLYHPGPPVIDRTTYTDQTGYFVFTDVEPKPQHSGYTITCSKSGFPTRTYTDQAIAAGQVLREDFDLGYVTASSPSSAVNPPWALFSLPMEPVNPDPVSVLSGIPIDYRLFRWDKPTQSLIAYDELMPGDFGNLNLDEGCWLYVDSPYTISYQAYGGSAPTRTVSLPRNGWSIVGCPFLVEKNWADMQVTQGTTTVSLETARNNGWIYSIGYYWDSETQSLIDVGLPDDLPTSTTLQPWHGHWVRSFVDNLSLTQR